MEFFDQYPRFYTTSVTGASASRLNQRHKAIISNNQPLIKNARILDIASHDGRWSFAALKAGAAHVVGVEGRPQLVKSAETSMQHYKIDPERYQFLTGDIFDEIDKFSHNEFDVIFCLGFFYHTAKHYSLLEKIRALQPKALILDTNVCRSPQPIIQLRMENSGEQHAAIPDKISTSRTACVGWPSKAAVDMMLRNLGFNPIYHNWHEAGATKNWSRLDDYKNHTRITAVAMRD